MNKRSNIVWCASLACLLFIAACSSTEKKDKLAGYVGAPENGLTKKQLADSNEIVCQLVPQERASKEDSGKDLQIQCVYENEARTNE